MTQPEKQKAFHHAIAKLKKIAAFADAMSQQSVTKETASTLRQLSHEAHEVTTKFHRVMWSDGN